MHLSILIPSVFDRDPSALVKKLLGQIGDKAVEVLVLADNRKRSTGHKRQALLDTAQGAYVTYIDDDDDVSRDYIHEIYWAINEQIQGDQLHGSPRADVIVFNSQAQLLGYGFGENPYIVYTGIEYENEESKMEGDRRVDIHRKPWHWCVWEASLAKSARFPDGYIDDDWYWLRQMMPRVQRQHRIAKVLHFYCYNQKTSLSGQGQPTC